MKKTLAIAIFVPLVSACGLFLQPSSGEDVQSNPRDAGVDLDVVADVVNSGDVDRADVLVAIDAGTDAASFDVAAPPDVEGLDVARADVFIPVEVQDADLAFSFDGRADNAVISTGTIPQFYGKITPFGPRFVPMGGNNDQGVSEAVIVLPQTEYHDEGTQLFQFSLCATLVLDEATTSGSLYQLGNYDGGIEIRAEIDGNGQRLLVRHHIDDTQDHDFYSEVLGLGTHSICLNFGGVQPRIMIDGRATLAALPAGYQGGQSMIVLSDDHRILAFGAGAPNKFNGHLDNLRVWFNKTELSDAEMRSVGKAPVPKPGPIFDVPVLESDEVDEISNVGVAQTGNAFGENATLISLDSRFALDMRNSEQNMEFYSIDRDDALLGRNMSYSESTFSLWIYREDNDGVVYQFGSDPNCIKLSIYLGEPLLLGQFAGNPIGMSDHNISLPVRQWTHLAVTLSPTVVRLYLDGVSVHESRPGIAQWRLQGQSDGDFFRVASDANASCTFSGEDRGFLNALFDNMRFYPYALNGAEVIEDMQR